MIDGETEISRAVAEQHAASDPTLKSMLDKGIPLTRNAYLMMNWGGDLPADWNHEHEADLPEFFRDPSAVAQMPRPVATKDHRD